MLSIRTNFIVALILLATNGAGAAACGAKGGGDAQHTTQKNVAQGGYGKVSEPFVVVARDRAVYGELRKLAGELPDVGADFFKSNLVVAAFLGERNTGGYSVGITREAGGALVVSEQTPPEGAMLTQALTNPFRIVSVPIADEEGVELQLQGSWTKALLRPYRVVSGEFLSGGGFAGRMEKFALEGGLSVARHEGLATLLFDLRGVESKRPRALKGAATGMVGKDGKLEIASTDAGALVQKPRSPLRVTGQFTNDGGNLALRFESLPPRLADGYGGSGQLEAAASAPTKNKPLTGKPAKH
ncbi:MAG: protease complex subunit PrcB family protein [Acidobacteria bacterium]|nr:protease complex subunit PrcB family protein [Acidobacteriota bacterium]